MGQEAHKGQNRETTTDAVRAAAAAAGPVGVEEFASSGGARDTNVSQVLTAANKRAETRFTTRTSQTTRS